MASSRQALEFALEDMSRRADSTANLVSLAGPRLRRRGPYTVKTADGVYVIDYVLMHMTPTLKGWFPKIIGYGDADPDSNDYAMTDDDEERNHEVDRAESLQVVEHPSSEKSRSVRRDSWDSDMDISDTSLAVSMGDSVAAVARSEASSVTLMGDGTIEHTPVVSARSSPSDWKFTNLDDSDASLVELDGDQMDLIGGPSDLAASLKDDISDNEGGYETALE